MLITLPALFATPAAVLAPEPIEPVFTMVLIVPYKEVPPFTIVVIVPALFNLPIYAFAVASAFVILEINPVFEFVKLVMLPLFSNPVFVSILTLLVKFSTIPSFNIVIPPEVLASKFMSEKLPLLIQFVIVPLLIKSTEPLSLTVIVDLPITKSVIEPVDSLIISKAPPLVAVTLLLFRFIPPRVPELITEATAEAVESFAIGPVTFISPFRLIEPLIVPPFLMSTLAKPPDAATPLLSIFILLTFTSLPIVPSAVFSNTKSAPNAPPETLTSIALMFTPPVIAPPFVTEIPEPLALMFAFTFTDPMIKSPLIVPPLVIAPVADAEPLTFSLPNVIFPSIVPLFDIVAPPPEKVISPKSAPLPIVALFVIVPCKPEEPVEAPLFVIPFFISKLIVTPIELLPLKLLRFRVPPDNSELITTFASPLTFEPSVSIPVFAALATVANTDTHASDNTRLFLLAVNFLLVFFFTIFSF